MAGFIYVMSNPAMPNLVKVGKSDRDPETFRKKELETTGVPEPFKVEYYAFVDDHNSVEKDVHSDLSKYRNKPNREFFKCSVPEGVLAIRQCAGSGLKHEEVFYKSPAEIEKEKKLQEEKNQVEFQGKKIRQEKERIQQSQKRIEETASENKYTFWKVVLIFYGVLILIGYIL